MRKLAVLILAIVGVAGAAALVHSATPALTRTGPMQIGTNLAGVVDYGTAWEFTNLFKASRPWMSQDVGPGKWDNGQPIALDSAGYPKLAPGQAACTLVGTNGHLPSGQYTCEFDGTGDLQFTMDVRKSERVSPNKYLLTVVSDGGIFLKIIASSPADPVRNIRLFPPGLADSTATFNPLFVDRLKPFSVIRFMDWGHTNGNPLVHWADRNTPDSIRQSGDGGVAIENMIELANTVHADPWFCMPHLADDDFIEHFAQMAKEKLAGDRKIYVEWSNETWNTFFPQGSWTAEQAGNLHVQPADVTAYQSRRVWTIWKRVFGDQSNRIVRVACGQQSNPAVAEEILKYLNGDCDAVACSAYFWPSDADKASFTESTTPAQVAASCIADLKAVGLPNIARHAGFAAEWSKRTGHPIELAIYEGGQHILPISGFRDGQTQLTPWHQAAIDVQTDPQMAVAYDTLMQGLSDMGTSVFCTFSYCGPKSKWGCWGALEYQDQPIEQAPKYATIVKWANLAKPQ